MTLHALAEIRDTRAHDLNHDGSRLKSVPWFMGGPRTPSEMDPHQFSGRDSRGTSRRIAARKSWQRTWGSGRRRFGHSGASFQVGRFQGGSAFETGSGLMPIKRLQEFVRSGREGDGLPARLRQPSVGESVQDHTKKARASIEAALPGLKAVPASDQAGNNQLVALARSTAWGHFSDRTLYQRLGHREYDGHVCVRKDERHWRLTGVGLEALAHHDS